MKKLNIIAAAVLVAAASVGSYASASEGAVKATAHTNAAISTSGQNSKHGSIKNFFARVKNRVETGLKFGTVSAVNSDGSFTVQNKQGTKTATVKTDASTTYTKDGQAADKTAVTVGAMVKIKGAFDKATSTISASIVNVIKDLKGINFKGTVTAISSTTLTVKAQDGTVYTVDESKAQIIHSFWFGTSSDVKVGDTVTVWGTHLNDSTSISARWIKDASPKPVATQ